jgi:hypothetical protein
MASVQPLKKMFEDMERQRTLPAQLAQQSRRLGLEV